MSLSNKDNTIRRASDLGTLVGASSRKGLVGKRDKVDFFKFSLSGRSSFLATLTGLKANVDLALLNGNGRVIVQSRKPAKKAEAINTFLDGGTFYLQIKSRTSRPSTPYRLNLVNTLQTIAGSSNNAGSVSNGGSGTTTRLVKISTLNNQTGARPSGDTVFLVDSVGSSGINLSAYSNGSVKQLGFIDLSGNVVLDTYGNKAVWFSTVNTVGSELFFYNGTTTKQITNSVSDTPEYLGMDGSRVFWLNKKQNGTNDLYLYDGTQNVLIGANINSYLSINVLQGKYQGLPSDPVNTSLVWKAPGGSDGGSDDELFLFNGDSGKLVQLTANDASNDSFKLNSGSNVAFIDDKKMNLYKSTTGTIVTLANENTVLDSMSGENVLFHNNLSLQNSFLYNGSTVKQITSDGNQSTPAVALINNSLLNTSNVVLSKRDGVTDSELFFYNGTTGQITQLTQRPGIDPPNTENEQLLYQTGVNVFWVGGGKIYVSDGNTGERKDLADTSTYIRFIGSNAFWEKDKSLFFYNSSTKETTKLADHSTFFSGLYEGRLSSGTYIGWSTDDEKTFLYNTVTQTATQLTDKGYTLGAISGSNAFLTRNSDGAYFYTS